MYVNLGVYVYVGMYVIGVSCMVYVVLHACMYVVTHGFP